MKLCDLLEDNSAQGIYVGVKYSDESVKALKKIIKELKLPNEVPSSKIHTTIIYSRKYVPNIEINDVIENTTAKPKKLIVFNTQENKRALVVELDCGYLLDRHNQIMQEYKTTYDYDTYTPHITLSYDIGDLEFNYEFDDNLSLELVKEYKEDLILNWKAT